MSRTISGTSTAAITLTSSADNPVSVTGTIDVANGTALYGTGGGSNSWTIDNSGRLGGGGSGYGISLGTSGSYVTSGVVTNEAGGTIAGGHTGLAIWGPGSVTNMAGGTITGGSYNKGVYFKGAGTVVNAGLIAAGNVAVYADLGGSVTNLATGTISGAGGVSFYNAVGTFTNAGVVIGTSGGVGAVSFYYQSTANRLIVDPGAVFGGNVFGGTGVLELAVGNGSAGSLSGLGGAITQFTMLQFDPGVQWTLAGDTAGLAGTVTIAGFTGNDTIDLTGFAAVSETFAGNALVLTDAGSAHATLAIQGTFASGDFQLASDGGGGTEITRTPRSFTWTGGSGAWNTPGNWDLASVPTSVDSAAIAEAGTNSVTIAADTVNAIANLALGAAGDTLAVNGVLNAAGTLAIDAGTLIAGGGLSAAAITDNGLLAYVGSHTLDNTPLALGGTLQLRNAGTQSTLTLGSGEIVTQAGTTATIDSTSGNGETAINNGTIDAAVAGGTMNIAPADGFANQGTISVSNGEYFSIQPGFGTFDNTGTVSVAGGSTLQIDDSGITPPIDNTGSITMASGTTLDLAGYYTPASLGNLINQGATTQIDGTLDGQNGTITLGAGSELNQVRLAGQIRNATIVPNGDLTVMQSGNASLWNDTYRGPIDVTSDNTRLTIYQGVTLTDATGLLPGTITMIGQADTLNFADQPPGTSQTLDNVTINVGNSAIADAIAPGFNGGTFTIGSNAAIVSATSGALASLTAGSGTTVLLDGTLSAIGNGGTFTLARYNTGSTFNNDGTLIAGNGDTLKLTTPIATDGNTGTIDLGSSGTLDIGAGVAANQTLVFTDATGMLKLRQPASFAASISGFVAGDTIDLPDIAADSAIWTAGTSGAPGQLAITDAGTAVATLSLLGTYTGIAFNVTSDRSGGSDIALACYAAGTRILTPRGEIPVERLREGDAVVTVSGAAQPIRWIGHRRVDLRRHPDKARVMPIRIAPHAFGEARPRRALMLSPDHAVFVENVLIPIKYLVDGVSVAPVGCATVTYYHIELPRHDVVLAEGMPAESYLEVGGRDAFANGGGVMRLHPDFHPPPDHCAMLWETHGYAPMVVVGATIERVRRELASRAAMRARARPRARPARALAS